MLKFTTLPEAIAYFDDPGRCQDMFEKIRWPDGNIICPNCLTERAYRMGDVKHYKCRNKSCGSRFSVIKGTFLENTKLSLSKWMVALYLSTSRKKGISSYQLSRDLKIGQKAAWFMLCRIRGILKGKKVDKLDNICEVDEVYVGGRFDTMHRAKRKKLQESGKDNKTPVMGMLEREGKARMRVIGKETFKELVREHIDSNASIVTDSHLGYKGLNMEFAGHNTVDHSKQQFKDGVWHTNGVEGMFSHFKRTIIGTHHFITPKHMQRYADEFIMRWNTRKLKDAERFIYSLRETEGRLKWKDLIAPSHSTSA